MSLRIIGYGAYNLCFDKLWGKGPNDSGPDFFQFIRNGKWPINAVKVICFRKSMIEGLPPRRAIPLFNSQKKLNPDFLTNLDQMVGRAADLGFWVQICIFSFQSVALSSDPSKWEFPENVPAELDPTKLGTNNCDRLRKFFGTKDETTFKATKMLAAQIAWAVRWRTNIIWEMGNEVRIQGCDANTAKDATCDIVAWYDAMWDRVFGLIEPDQAPHTMSTGVENEQVLWTTQRPFNGCANETYGADPYDFHADQWNYAGDYAAGMDAAVQRMQNYGSPRELTINDDGAKPDSLRTARLQAWAGAAFQRKLWYLSKQQYPPGQLFDLDALNALKKANDAHPLT